jgi:ATP-binding cassette subfamily C (CFTR/MRP) protein 4
MRQQVIAAIHAKVLRLNSASIVHASTGHIVNMASNDVRRFDDALPFWLFTWAAPLETVAVLLMVSLELGFVPAICGVGALLSVMPLQALLVRTVGGLRMNTAVRTDERVRLTGEVIQGALAMKMLGWEEPFAKAICNIRGQEVHFAGRMAQIRGLNLALQFCMTPVASFTTFAVYYALNKSLSLPSIFYVLSLLHLPKLYMVYFFVLGKLGSSRTSQSERQGEVSMLSRPLSNSQLV